MTPVSLCCPECDATLKMVNRPAEGKKIKCPKCEALFVGSDHVVSQGSTAIKSKSSVPPVPAAKSRPSRDDDDDLPRSRKSRPDNDEDDDQPRRSKKKKKAKSSAGLIIGLCVGGGVFLVAIVLGVGGLVWWKFSAPTPRVVAQVDAPPVQPAAVVQAQDVPPVNEKPAEPKVNEKPAEPKVKAKRDPKTPAAPPNTPPPTPPPSTPKSKPAPVATPVDLDPMLLAKTTRATAYVRVDFGSGKRSATGSGFLVKATGNTAYLVTNLHVISVEPEAPQPSKTGGSFPGKGPKTPPSSMIKKKGPGGMMFGPQPKDPNTAPKVTVVLGGGTPEEQSFPAEVVAVDEEGDVAALRITGVKNLPEVFDVSQEVAVAEGQPVYFFGHPTKKTPLKSVVPPSAVGKGTIASLRRDPNNELIDIQISGDIGAGNSGGPVVDAEGRLVGVAVATMPGKQTGSIVPAGELTQMFKGRLSLAAVLQLQQQGPRVDLMVESWIHDRKSNVRSRNGVALRFPDEPVNRNLPRDEFTLLARLADPLTKIKGTSAFFAVTDNVPPKSATGDWAQIANAIPVALKIQDQYAVGKFRLPNGAAADRMFAFQFSYINADGKTIFTQPHLVRLTFPDSPKSAQRTLDPSDELPTNQDHGQLAFLPESWLQLTAR